VNKSRGGDGNESRIRHVKATVLVGVCLAAGCSFNVGSGKPSTERDMADEVVGDVDMASGDGADMLPPPGAVRDMAHAPGVDMTPVPDLGPVCVAGAKRCSANAGAVETCRGDGSGWDPTATCPSPYTCTGSGESSHCKVLVPTAPVMTSDLQYVGLTATALGNAGNYVFDTNDGSISGPGGPIRGGSDPTMTNVTNGIGFHRSGNVAIWSFATLSIGAGANVVFKETLTGGNTVPNQFGIAFVSQGDVSIEGSATIDLRGRAGDPTIAANLCKDTTPGPGGGAGGSVGSDDAGGAGAGKPGTGLLDGGGGGSYGGLGHQGGAGGGAGGALYTSLTAAAGGSGGGGGCSDQNSNWDATGGGGGGALQVVSMTNIAVAGAINAGGCGGIGAQFRGGGGAGSGGVIILEAPAMHFSKTGQISVNGGGGGAGGDFPGNKPGSNGAAGGPGNTSAFGGTNPKNGGAGGNGGKVGGIGGGAPTDGSGGAGAGGGGGGAGRMRFNSLTGASSITIDSGAQISPAATDPNNATTVGNITLK
jgi:hypothetical protein